VSTQVTAVLVVHDEPTYAERAIKAIERQTLSPTRLVIVDSSKIAKDYSINTIKVAHTTKLGAILRTALDGLEVSSEHWIWLVHDDSEPNETALAELVGAIEGSDSIVQVGPMQLSAKNPRQISQLGLTLSPFGELINPIKRQIDQQQHDTVADVLAVSTSGMLVRSDAYQEVGGLDDRAPALSGDIDLSLRFHRHNYRVVIAPRAKVIHAGLSLAGKRSGSWLSGSPKTAMRRASINIHLVHDALPLAFLYWLALPAITIYRIFWRLAQKRPGYLWSELRAGFWGFFTFPKRLASRKKVGKASFRSLNPLRATWSTVRAHNLADVEEEESAQSLAAFERGDHELSAEEQSKSFTRAGGWLLFTLLLLVSWQQLPSSAALTGGATLPLSDNWFNLFARAGASWQPITGGFFGPSDPFNWVLLFLGSVTFWAPNLALVLLVWLARGLAFLTAWKALSLVSAKAWVRNLGASLYAVLPAFGAALEVVELPSVIATIVLPWLIYSIARAAGLGRSGSARSDARTWSWVGLSGILLAVLGASSPFAAVLALVVLALVAATRIKRFGYLFWIPLPLGAIYVPWVAYAILELRQPFALLADPTVGVRGSTSALSSLVDITNWLHWPLGLILLISMLSLLIRRWVVSLSIVVVGLLAFAGLMVSSSLEFPADLVSRGQGIDRVTSSGGALAAVVGITLIGLLAHLASSGIGKGTLRIIGASLLIASVPLAGFAAITPTKVSQSDGSVSPLLLQKQAELGTELRLLVIDKVGEDYLSNWTELSGVNLEDSNIAYRFSKNDSKAHQDMLQVVGDLVSANGLAKGEVLKSNQIGYVLVPNRSENAGLVSALEAATVLEGAGLTPFGDLWRVLGTSAEQSQLEDQDIWSITKSIQLLALTGFLLLAIPSRPRRRRAKDSVIFIDQSESELDV
jgi:GT2 family glycosyltransferase